MVAPAVENIMQIIANPFVGNWDIAQGFQLVINNDIGFLACSFFDRRTQRHIIELNTAPRRTYYAVPANFTLRQLLTHMGADLNDAHFAQAALQRRHDDAPALPAANDTEAVLDLTVERIMNDAFAAQFDLRAEVAGPLRAPEAQA